VRILRLIQEREIETIGAMAATKVNVRIIAATHRNLARMVKQGAFREDLYYRLLVVPIELPPLRDRTGDIEVLVNHFFARSRIKYGRQNLTMSPDLLCHFVEYRWPGNVRELENTIERLVLLAKGAELKATDLLESLHSGMADGETCPLAKPEQCVNLQAMEKQMILQALKLCGGNQTQAARNLGMSRRTLAYRLEKYGLYGDKLRAFKHGAG
jgi:transcriptional regulator with PAS, ATPase and Fis domain